MQFMTRYFEVRSLSDLSHIFSTYIWDLIRDGP